MPNGNTTLNVKLRSNYDSERRNWEVIMMALNVETENATRITLNTDTNEWWLWTPNKDEMMALNAETGKVTLNAKLRSDDGFELRNQETRHRWLSGVKIENVTLNVNLGSDDNGFECRNWEAIMMTLNAETENATRMALNTDTKKWWLNAKLGSDDGFEHWNQETRHWWLSGAKTENATPNVNLGSDDDCSERWNWEAIMMTLNAEAENATRMALNTDTEKWWLWTPNEDAMMALNAKNEKWWLWTPNWKCGTVTPNVVNREWTVALNAERRCDDGSERRNRECHSDGSECQNWKHDSERQSGKWWLWTPKPRMR